MHSVMVGSSQECGDPERLHRKQIWSMDQSKRAVMWTNVDH